MKLRSKKKVLKNTTTTTNNTYSPLTTTHNNDILMKARSCWDGLKYVRSKRQRNVRYCSGDQWGDKISVDGRVMTERQYIQEKGSEPLVNNIIHRPVRNFIGIYRGQNKTPVCSARDREEQAYGELMTTILEYNNQINKISEINASTFREYLLGGDAVQKITYGYMPELDKEDCWVHHVDIENFFIDTNTKDIRGWDCNMLGEFYDVDFLTLCSRFAHSKEDVQQLKNIYAHANSEKLMHDYLQDFGKRSEFKDTDFLYPPIGGLCRVIEVWTRETRERYRCFDPNNGEIFKIDPNDYNQLVEQENKKRLAEAQTYGIDQDDIPLIQAQWMVDTFWYQRFLSPNGYVIEERESPYWHKSHPYIFKFYPFLGQEVQPFVSDFIDQQRYINRLITLHDWIMKSSAKGVLVVPEDCVSEYMTLEEISDQWTRFDGVIVIKAKPGVNIPQQISSNSTNIGIGDLLNIQMKLLEDISGINGALQGQTLGSNMTGALYAQQTANATTSLLDILDSFNAFTVDVSTKQVKTIQQYYNLQKIQKITGKQTDVNLQQIQDIEFDLSITNSSSSPIYRQIANETLMQFWQAGAINIETLLEVGDFPFADDLLQQIQTQKEQVQQGQTPQQLPQQLSQQISQQGNPQAQAALQQMITK